MASVFSIHFCGDRVKALYPASFLNLSNSIGLKFRLCNCSQSPKNSIVSFPRIQLLITIKGSSLLYRAISVSDIKFILKVFGIDSNIHTFGANRFFYRFLCHSITPPTLQKSHITYKSESITFMHVCFFSSY